MKPVGSSKNRRGGSRADDRKDYVNDDRKASLAARVAQQQHVSTIFFTTTSQSDLEQPWFHKHTTRDEAVQQLEHAAKGSFVVRPSSQRSCYALSWLDENEVVRHNLIYNQFPGFSLELKDNGANKVYPTLTELVKNCPFLSEGLPEKSLVPRKQQTGDEMIERLLQLLRENNDSLDSISWTLSVLENANNLHTRDQCERRTYISFCRDEFCAPQHFKLEKTVAEALFEALGDNHTVKTLILKGHFGFMRVNFTPHLVDALVPPLCESLILNRTLTHLDLSNNGIGNAGAQSLAELIRYNHALRVLNLKNNFIGRDGILALANGLTYNKTLDEVVVGQQFWRGQTMGRDVNVSNDPFARSVVNLIEESFARKREVLQPVTAGTTYFHGFLSPEQAESRLQSQPNGSFLLYLNHQLPSVVVVCFKNSNMHANDPAKPFVVLHKAIYRVDYGYSFSGQKKPVPSLVDSLGWYLLANTPLQQEGLGSGAINEDLLDRFRPIWDLHPLWGLLAVPTPEEERSFCIDAFPTLQQVVSRNRSFLQHPVPRPATSQVDAAHQLSSSSMDSLSNRLLYNCKLST